MNLDFTSINFNHVALSAYLKLKRIQTFFPNTHHGLPSKSSQYMPSPTHIHHTIRTVYCLYTFHSRCYIVVHAVEAPSHFRQFLIENSIFFLFSETRPLVSSQALTPLSSLFPLFVTYLHRTHPFLKIRSLPEFQTQNSEHMKRQSRPHTHYSSRLRKKIFLEAFIPLRYRRVGGRD
jgi:hypothetical protein